MYKEAYKVTAAQSDSECSDILYRGPNKSEAERIYNQNAADGPYAASPDATHMILHHWDSSYEHWNPHGIRRLNPWTVKEVQNEIENHISVYEHDTGREFTVGSISTDTAISPLPSLTCMKQYAQSIAEALNNGTVKYDDLQSDRIALTNQTEHRHLNER